MQSCQMTVTTIARGQERSSRERCRARCSARDRDAFYHAHAPAVGSMSVGGATPSSSLCSLCFESLCFEREVWFALFLIFFGRGQLAPGSAPARGGAACMRLWGKEHQHPCCSDLVIAASPKWRRATQGERSRWMWGRMWGCGSHGIDAGRDPPTSPSVGDATREVRQPQPGQEV